VIDCAQMRPEREVLKDKPDTALMRRQVDPSGSGEKDPRAQLDGACLRREETGNGRQQRRLAGSATPPKNRATTRVRAVIWHRN